MLRDASSKTEILQSFPIFKKSDLRNVISQTWVFSQIWVSLALFLGCPHMWYQAFVLSLWGSPFTLNSVRCFILTRFLKNIFLRIVLLYFWLCWVFMAARAFLRLRLLGATPCCGAQAAHCGSLEARGLRQLQPVGSWALEHRLNSCGTWAQLLSSRCDLPGSGIEPVFPALAGGFLATETLRKPSDEFYAVQRGIIFKIYFSDATSC